MVDQDGTVQIDAKRLLPELLKQIDLSDLQDTSLLLLLSKIDYSLFEVRFVSLLTRGIDQMTVELWNKARVNPTGVLEKLWESNSDIILQPQFLKILQTATIGQLESSRERLCSLISQSFSTLPEEVQIPAGYLLIRLSRHKAQTLIPQAHSPKVAVILGASSCMTCVFRARDAPFRCTCNPCADFAVDIPNDCRDYSADY
jgi:hypothetical protein